MVTVCRGLRTFSTACKSGRTSLDEFSTRQWLRRLGAADLNILIAAVIDRQSFGGLSTNEKLTIIAKRLRFRALKPGDSQKIVSGMVLYEKTQPPSKPEIPRANN
jgi:hypothetical protein